MSNYNEPIEISAINCAINLMEIDINTLDEFSDTLNKYDYYKLRISNLIERLEDLIRE